MNAPYLESSKHIDRLFPGVLQNIKFHILHNISKLSIDGLRTFTYNKISELCYGTLYKEKIG